MPAVTHIQTHSLTHIPSSPDDSLVLLRLDVQVVSEDKEVIVATIQANPDKEKFPLKMRDEIVNVGFSFLNKKGLVPQDDDSDDEFDLAGAYEDNGIEW